MASPDYTDLVAGLREFFDEGRTLSAAFRKEQLQGLHRMLVDHRDTFLEALKADLNKGEFESTASEVDFTDREVMDALRDLDSWMAPTMESTPVALLPASSYVKADPQGVVLIVGPFNYPLHLAIAPLIGALAAGNCAVIKPSELTVSVSKVLAELLPKYVDHRCVSVVQGAVPETQALLAQRWDHIFFTGSERVGKIVMRAASEHLTKVTLELGGKSPVIVDPQFQDLRLAARRIMWGKCINSGQTCIAPDYVLVPAAQRDALVAELRAAAREFYGPRAEESDDFCRIVSDNHTRRLKGLVDSVTADGSTIAFGGRVSVADRFVEPTVVVDVKGDHALMKEEIFGPILPVVAIDSVDEAVRFVNARPHPLALYLFSDDQGVRDAVMARTSSGGVCINDTIMHITNPRLPFGGVGTSGIGAYHGRHSFDCFSHRKSVLVRSSIAMTDLPQRYPPYDSTKVAVFRHALKSNLTGGSLLRFGKTATVIGALAFLLHYHGSDVVAHRVANAVHALMGKL